MQTSIDFFKTRLSCDPHAGTLTWLPILETDRYKKTWNKRYAGKPAGTIRKDGYVSINLDGTFYLAHRLVWLFANGILPERHLDHIDMDTTRNCIANLRMVDQSQNKMNRGKQKNNACGLKGVYFDHRRKNWIAQIVNRHKHIHLGTFKSAESAHLAYCAASAKLHGNFGRTR